MNEYRELLRLSKGTKEEKQLAFDFLKNKIAESGSLSPMERMLFKALNEEIK